jgi:hypothetical protein
MALVYMLTTAAVLIVFADQVPAAFALIIESAFNPTAAAGGFLGATVMLAMRSGIARGIFSNEAGLGSAPIVAAAAKTKWPAEQGLVSMTGTFIDTINDRFGSGGFRSLDRRFEWCGYDSICFCNGFSCNGKIFIDDRFSVICFYYYFGLELLR